ncbi:hypothetical protein KEK_20053 [Mycolicibacterium thermoresistibile ATCC 19527]|uniref:Uncharacterized protein n=1 Tax=Mycolicibacterium thermoresistibile (strain ATCC 19527 / DSM 44167 / CIP 105390 / JCM 6362 / NCTC 10409 / 316) TaxID=1078020 RepID=G7CLW8_MYCT3|nr:hypothetical protein KEK_20053 [Mycolicibacterium thermoresistibile ATCC 19527]
MLFSLTSVRWYVQPQFGLDVAGVVGPLGLLEDTA